jgi:hypothetical protein
MKNFNYTIDKLNKQRNTLKDGLHFLTKSDLNAQDWQEATAKTNNRIIEIEAAIVLLTSAGVTVGEYKPEEL